MDYKCLPTAGPEGLGRAGNPRITEDVVKGSIIQCQREETPWVAQSPADGVGGTVVRKTPLTVKKGLSGFGKTRNTFGPQCLILKPLCILREI